MLNELLDKVPTGIAPNQHASDEFIIKVTFLTLPQPTFHELLELLLSSFAVVNNDGKRLAYQLLDHGIKAGTRKRQHCSEHVFLECSVAFGQHVMHGQKSAGRCVSASKYI